MEAKTLAAYIIEFARNSEILLPPDNSAEYVQNNPDVNTYILDDILKPLIRMDVTALVLAAKRI